MFSNYLAVKLKHNILIKSVSSVSKILNYGVETVGKQDFYNRYKLFDQTVKQQ